MNTPVEHIAAETFHGRHGALRRSFRYGVDYVLLDPEDEALRAPSLFSRNRLNLWSVQDRDHGGPPGHGRGAAWARDVLARHGVNRAAHCELRLLTQPRFLTYQFNPVSFWLAFEGPKLRAVIAEVNNTFGDRHSYLCHAEDHAAITSDSVIRARKLMHVSPFQDVAGNYSFRFDVTKTAVDIHILYRNGSEGLVATLSGARSPLENGAILRALMRRPLGALRTTILIHWQALILKVRGAAYRPRPLPPTKDVS